MVRVAGDAGDDMGVACLDGARRAPQLDDGRCAAHRHMLEKARREPDMLGEADGRIGREGEARDGKSVDIALADASRLDQSSPRPARETNARP